jgi:ankyrin repeat protein
MLSNPLYHSLTHNNGEIESKIDLKTSKSTTSDDVSDDVSDTRSYYMLSRPTAGLAPFVFRGKTYVPVNRHLTVYETWDSNNHYLSPVHATLQFSGMIIHFYLDKGTNHLTTRIDLGDTLLVEADLSNQEKLQLSRLLKDYGRDMLDELSRYWVKKHNESDVNQQKKLIDLEHESRDGIYTDQYKSALTATIQAIDEHNILRYQPEYGVRKQLLERRNLIDKVLNVKTDISPVATLDDNEVEQKKPASAMPTPKSKPASKKVTASTGSAKSAAKKRKQLEAKLVSCQKDDTGTFFKTVKQIDALKKSLKNILIQACIDGDMEAFEQSFNSKDHEADNMLIPALLATCVAHDRKDIFKLIYDQIQNRTIKHDYYVNAYISLDPLKLSAELSLLELALREKSFFKDLLCIYHYDPNKSPVFCRSLLSEALASGDDESFDLLLEAGIDINEVSSKINAVTTVTPIGYFSPVEKELQQKALEVDGRTPLHYAAIVNNPRAVKTLLERKANTALKTKKDGYTAFHEIISRKILNKEIISLFLQHGHSIDEILPAPTSQTALYFACINGNLAAVEILLSLGAKPDFNIQPTTNIPPTPLLAACQQESVPIVTAMLKFPMSISATGNACKYCIESHPSLAEILRKTHMGALLKQADKFAKEATPTETEKLSEAELYYKAALMIAVTYEEKTKIRYGLVKCLDKHSKYDDALSELDDYIKMCDDAGRSDPIRSGGYKTLANIAITKRENIQARIASLVCAVGNNTVSLHGV